jgi:TolB protein
MGSRKWNVFFVLVVMVAIVVLAGPASATFPGKNGRIAFIKAVDNQTGTGVGDIFTVNPDGSGVRQVTFFGSNTVAPSYEGWSPDGRQLVFELFDVSTMQGQLWLVNADGTNPHLLLNDPSFGDAEPSFSPDGSQIAFARCGIDCAIYRVRTDGSGLTAIIPFNFNPDVFNLHPAYSPNGQTIAFTSTTRDGVLSAIYLANADGSNIRRLTPTQLEAWVPDWSPDGEKIVFTTRFFDFGFGGLDEEIWVINVDGTNLTRLTNNNSHWHGYFTGPHDILPSWSPQGNAIAFERDAPDFSSSVIYTMNPDGTGQKQTAQVLARRSLALPVIGGQASGKRVMQHLRLVNGEGILPRWGTAPD